MLAWPVWVGAGHHPAGMMRVPTRVFVQTRSLSVHLANHRVMAKRLSQVDEAFAWDEGEGDRTREWWLDAHRQYFARQATCEGFEIDDAILTIFAAAAGDIPPRGTWTNSRLPRLAMRASIRRRSVANSSGRSQPTSGAAWSRAPTFCSSNGR
jgi:hypothetical protein